MCDEEKDWYKETLVIAVEQLLDRGPVWVQPWMGSAIKVCFYCKCVEGAPHERECEWKALQDSL